MSLFRYPRFPLPIDDDTVFTSQQSPPLGGGEQTEVGRPPYSRQIDWHTRYPTDVILQGPTTRKAVAFTFDDGPDDTWTPKILDVLAQYRVPATFFLVGNRVQTFPNVVRRIVPEGHVIGNHTWDHPRLTDLTPQQVRSQITRTDDVIARVAGVRPNFFRPPYGGLNESIIQINQRLKNKIILWNVDSLDWSGVSTNTLVNSVLANIKPGAIVLFHSAFGREGLQNTVEALPRLITTLRSEGYELVTIAKLLNLPAYK